MICTNALCILNIFVMSDISNQLIFLGAYMLIAPQSLPSKKKRRRQRRRPGYIPRIALNSPSMSAWARLFASGSDRALITFTTLDYPSFNYLALRFEVLYNKYTPWSANGKIKIKPNNADYRRPRSLDSRGCLGLVLAHLRTKGSLTLLGMLFGCIASITNLYIRFGRRLLLHVLYNIEGSKIKLPDQLDVELFKTVIQEKYPLLTDCWFVLDGLKMPLQQPGDPDVQRVFYNGWTHYTYVSNVFVFTPDGLIISCALNFPGCVHDSLVADYGNVYEKLKDHVDRFGGKGVGDSAFTSSRCPFIIKSARTLDNPTDYETALNEDATSLRQTAEWGMRAFQGSFPRLKEDIVYEENGERYLLLSSAVLLYNFRARYVGFNQIRSVFLPQLELGTADQQLEVLRN